LTEKNEEKIGCKSWENNGVIKRVKKKRKTLVKIKRRKGISEKKRKYRWKIK